MSEKPVSAFTAAVIQAIAKIPKGRVATYAQIAALAGKPHAARGVAWILNSSSKKHKLPWQRVLGSKGTISFPKDSAHFKAQKRLLEKEGVRFVGKAGKIDLARFQWKTKPAKSKISRIKPRMFS